MNSLTSRFQTAQVVSYEEVTSKFGSTRFQSKEVMGAGEFLVEAATPGLLVIIFASEGRREDVAEAVGLVEICAGTNLAMSSWSAAEAIPASLLL